MKHECYTTIIGFECPVCKMMNEGLYMWLEGAWPDMRYVYEICWSCRTLAGFAIVNDLPIPLGTFEHAPAFREFVYAAGRHSFLDPAGKFWDSDNQRPTHPDPDEIPF